MKKVALYCRVSSEDQKERDTIENQIEILHTFVEMKGTFEIYKEYLDNGVSGTVPFEQRPEGKKLIDDASKKLFDSVLVWKIDRFGRDTLSGLTAVEMLRKYDIEIISVTEPFDLNTPTGRFQFITYLNMAELERNNILDRMFLGATRAAKKGKWLGGIVPYGYKINKDGYLEIEDTEAEIIRKIFNLYIYEGLSTIDIAIYLNNLGIPSSCGTGKGKRTKNITTKWRSGSIQRILSNTTYMGIHEYGKRASRRKETIIREVPAIISKEVFDKAQDVKKYNMLISKRNNNKREYLLRGLIKCEECGKNFYGVSYKDKSASYVCSGKRGENKKILGVQCNNLNIKADTIEEIVWNECLEILTHYESYISEMIQNNKTINNSLKEDIAKLQQALNDKKNEKNNILTLYRKNLITEEELETQLQDIRNEEKKLTDLINEFKIKSSQFDNESDFINDFSKLLEQYRQKLSRLTFKEKREIVELLVNNISVKTIVQNGMKQSDITIVYNLGSFDSMVKLGTHTDMGSDNKFEFHKNKKIYHQNIYKYNNVEISPGMRLRELRLNKNLTINKLSKLINVSSTTLRHVEQDKIKPPFSYYYWKVICNYFNINHIEYFNLNELKEDTLQEKLLKIRALLGAKSWDEVGKALGYSKEFTIDLLTRYKGNNYHIEKINNLLNSFCNYN